MDCIVFDLECDNLLLDKITKLHCVSYFNSKEKVFETLTRPEDIINLFKEDYIFCGHNITRFDFPVLKKVLNIDPPEFMIDTLALSWYLYPNRLKHGLEGWGEDFGIKKPEIKDWSNLTVEEYSFRCEEDVKINTTLWNKQSKFLNSLYEGDYKCLLEYLHFKMDCVKKQEEIGLKLDIDKINSLIGKWSPEISQKANDLKSVMPKVAVKRIKTYKNAIEIDGNVSTEGDLFFQSFLDKGGIKKEEIKLFKIVDWEDPNSASFKQLKDWLNNLGWKPKHIKHVRNKKTGEVKLIPQIKSQFEEGELCESIKELFIKEPKLELLEGLFIISHRLSILEGFLKDQRGGRIYPSMGGLTNTLRLKHKVVVNLPATYKKYGEDIRSCIIADEGCSLIGADLSNIEDRTKRHYIYKYDPDYVETMNTPGYDAHLELGVLAKFLTKEQAEAHKNGTEDYKMIRNKAKITNFSATYKVGAEALARNANIKLSEARKLLKVYWDRNSAILDIEADCKIKQIGDSRWLLNPISGFWYSLRNDKDKFSTLNQGSAVFIFDMWLKEQIDLGIEVPFQYHDEDLLCVLNEEVQNTKLLIKQAIHNVNIKYPLNVSIGCSIEVGKNYSSTH